MAMTAQPIVKDAGERRYELVQGWGVDDAADGAVAEVRDQPERSPRLARPLVRRARLHLRPLRDLLRRRLPPSAPGADRP